jgi:hypothetical protein
MMGTIAACMQDLVTKNYGLAKWKESLKSAGIPESKHFSTLEEVPDAQILAIMKGIATANSISLAQVMEAFGEHWSNLFAPKLYPSYFSGAKSTRELLLSLDNVHVQITQRMKGAKPPRFRYEWKGDNDLVMHSQSARGLVALMPGLVAGLGKRFKDNPTVKVAGNAVHVHFA